MTVIDTKVMIQFLNGSPEVVNKVLVTGWGKIISLFAANCSDAKKT